MKFRQGRLRSGGPSGPPVRNRKQAVAIMLSEYTNDENIIAAGFLHDTVEDVPEYTFEHLEKDFNKKVADIVLHISEHKCDPWGKPISWKKRKQTYLDSLEKAPKEALMVSAADTINNLDSLLMTYKLNGVDVWKKFGSGIDNKMRFYGNIIDLFDRRLKGELASRARKSYIALESALRSRR